MKVRTLLLSAFSALMAAVSCSDAGVTDVPVQAAQIDSMTLREKVSQMFFIRPEAMDPNETKTFLTPSMRATFRQYPVGGFCLFAQNITDPEQTLKFTSDLHSLARRPLLTIDEEGGRVARIGNNPLFGVRNSRNMLLVPEDSIYGVAANISSYLKKYGFDIDLAPVADVNTNPKNPVIGERAMSADPEEASRKICRYIDGLNANGIVGCLKHFPGHGDTKTDSHKGYASTGKNWKEINECEMVTFRAGIEKGVDMVMIAHIAAPRVTGCKIPSTLSPVMITDKLRGELGYKGIIISDSMGMDAVSKVYDPGEAAILAILAGTDIVLTSPHFKKAIDAVVAAVEDGVISEERINESVERILALKAKCAR